MPAAILQLPTEHLTTTSVLSLIHQQDISIHFQPIVALDQPTVFAHEALARLPAHCPYPTPDALFSAARQQGVTIQLELACFRLAMQAWAQTHSSGKLFINLSASALVQAFLHEPKNWLSCITHNAGNPLSGVVVELTEHEHVTQHHILQQALSPLRQMGAALALDDFGDGRSSLRIWSELHPEYVKIDKYFTQNVDKSSQKLQTLRALQQLAEIFGAQLIAEGVEHSEELQVLRDLGMDYAQGYFLGRPQAQPTDHLPEAVSSVLLNRHIAVLPQQRHASNRGRTAHSLLKTAPCLPALVSHDDIAEHFKNHPELQTVALVDEQGHPVGLFSRRTLHDLYLKPYSRELYGRRPGLSHANQHPLLVDLHTPIENLTQILTSNDQRYLSEGFIITEGGRYRGLGTGEQLVRTVTEARIEAARHANPLTYLPGNIPITQHIERLLDNHHAFAACYADLNQFKSYNDHYGYWSGDKMIRLQAECLQAACNPQCDFVGHVGGDDFVLLMQSPDWHARLSQAVLRFNQSALELFDPQARQAGGIVTEDRYGVPRFHACTTLSLGVVEVQAGQFQHPEEVANAAAATKHEAKAQGLGVYVAPSSTKSQVH